MTAPRIGRLVTGDPEASIRGPRPTRASRDPLAEAPELPAAEGLDLQEIPPARQSLEQSLPDNAALLKVVRKQVDGRECFQLEGYFRRRLWASNRTDEVASQQRPELVLADELDGLPDDDRRRQAALRCYTFMVNWSTTKRGLHRWISMLRRQVGAELRLIVWDDTDFGIAWELFRHNMDGECAWLGAAVQVVRWTTVHDSNRPDQFTADVNEAGGAEVLYYEDPQMVPQGQSIRPEPGAPGYQGRVTMVDLLQALMEASRRYGLVYVRGHGRHGARLADATLAGVRLADLDGVPLPGLRQSRALVFLNTCNSARGVIDRGLGEELNRNFAEIFLRERASAVVATLAEVQISHSAALALALVRKARAGGVHLPEYLRRRRAQYAANLPAHTLNPTNADLSNILAFLYASSFVYFGHPDSVFRLGAP